MEDGTCYKCKRSWSVIGGRGMRITRLTSGFKALGKMYQLLAQENYYFRGGVKSQQQWIDYNNSVTRIKKAISKLENTLVY